ncbi:MAG: hypothetical protein M1827_006077 [Pycnora praestabilis]|nr:MAG: hypothetical protein M1827_006077 [Pycnora praestabilis]
MASLSETIEASEDYLEIYREDHELFRRAENLYIAVLEGVEGMMEWIDKNAFKEAVKAFFQQDSYANTLEEQITTEIQGKTKAFCNRATECLHRRIKSIENGVNRVEDHTASIKHGMHEVRDDTVSIKNIVTTLSNQLLANVQSAQWKYQSELTLLALAEMQRPSIIVIQAPTISVEDLRNLLQVDCKTVDSDTQLALDYGRAMTLARQRKATWLMQEPDFQGWFQASGSHILTVDGMEQETDAASPLTYFCTMLYENLSSLQVGVALIFICGLHAKPGDYLEGARGIMRSLIHQLLLQRWDFDCSFLDYAFILEVQKYDISHLCRLFRNLLTSAPTATIFCMIDGISEYDTHSRIGDVNVMMGYMRDIVAEMNRENSGIDFKLMLTSATACRSSRMWFPDGTHIFMPDESGLDGQIEFNLASESDFLANSGFVNQGEQY